jgi:dolichyl-phosphate beta-glucosyltransferase
VTVPDGPAVVVVPCYNEAHRLDEAAFVALARSRKVRLLFVDDGSTDATHEVLARMALRTRAIEVFSLDANTGKAEAVRRGLLRAVRGGASVVGYYDADLATPPTELLRLATALRSSPELAGVFGCRVARLGSSIKRNAVRHYLGRTYATIASMALGITVYDTQCGAKLFRVNETFVAALSEPFRSSWAFDVELLQRLLHGFERAPAIPVGAFLEVPLEEWNDVSGSKLRVGPAAAALFDLARIARLRRTPEPLSDGGVTQTAQVMAPGVNTERRTDPDRSEQARRRRA